MKSVSLCCLRVLSLFAALAIIENVWSGFIGYGYFVSVCIDQLFKDCECWPANCFYIQISPFFLHLLYLAPEKQKTIRSSHIVHVKRLPVIFLLLFPLLFIFSHKIPLCVHVNYEEFFVLFFIILAMFVPSYRLVKKECMRAHNSQNFSLKKVFHFISQIK